MATLTNEAITLQCRNGIMKDILTHEKKHAMFTTDK